MAEERLSIGEVAALTHCKAPTIRYYEGLGLLDAPARTAGGHRTYSGIDVRRLAFIRRSRELGFSLDTIRGLLDLAAKPDRSCCDVDRLASEHIAEIAEKLRLLSAMRGALQDMLDECRHTTIHECRIIESLSPDSDVGHRPRCPVRHCRRAAEGVDAALESLFNLRRRSFRPVVAPAFAGAADHMADRLRAGDRLTLVSPGGASRPQSGPRLGNDVRNAPGATLEVRLFDTRHKVVPARCIGRHPGAKVFEVHHLFDVWGAVVHRGE